MTRKIYVLIFLLIFSSFMSSALRINEVELNPVDGRNGKEWIEVYNENDEDIDISSWMIYDGIANETKRFTIPSGVIIESKNYYVIEFNSAVLNNGGDYVILYNANGGEVDRTDTLKETTSGIETWQYCNSWNLIESTKGSKNSCEEEQEIQEQEVKNETSQEIINESSSNFSLSELKEDVNTKIIKEKLEVIKLNSENINNEEQNSPVNSQTKGNTKEYLMYGILIFVMLILALFLFKRSRNKNEFE